MRICLRRGYHHVFDDLIEHPPSGVEYVIPGLISSKGQLGLVNILKRKAWRMYSNLMGKPNSIRINPPKDTQLIHSNSGFLIEDEMPWVVDLEHVASFVGFEVGMLEKVKGVVMKRLTSDYCKKIMPWTVAGQRSIEYALGSREIKHKMEVVYPAISPLRVKKKKHDGINILFVSYGFFNKGGKEVLEACDALRRKHDFNLTMISDVPDEYREMYPNFNYVKPNLPRKRVLEEYFSMADIFVLPSYMDTFGMVYLEAMSAGIPIVGSNIFAVPEIVGKAGKFVDIGRYSWYGKDWQFAWKKWQQLEELLENKPKPEIVHQIMRYVGDLIDSKTLRNRMGRYGIKEVEKGKFSIKRRNIQLKRIYEEAVRK
jgi:glycosyltransferase involved in cell wall biosynthesis